MMNYGEPTKEMILQRMKHKNDRDAFEASLLVSDSFHAQRAMQIFFYPTKNVTVMGVIICHPLGDYYINGIDVQMLLEAIEQTTETRSSEHVIDAMMIPDGDWRASAALKMFAPTRSTENGQAKILYSTLYPFCPLPTTDVVVTVVGSSAVDGGGASYDVLAHVLELEDIKATLHLYDKFEVTSTVERGSVTIHRHNSYYAVDYPGTICDILIDDSYVAGQPNVAPDLIKYKRASLKSFNQGIIQPHYQGHECRLYVGCDIGDRRVRMPGMDECVDCKMWSRLLSNFKYVTAEYIWHSVIRMGVVPCAPYSGVSLAHDVGAFDLELRRYRRVTLASNSRLAVGSLAISAAINARAGNVFIRKGIVSLAYKLHSKLLPYRTTLTSIQSRELPDFMKMKYDLTNLIPDNVTVAVVGVEPAHYLQTTVALVPPTVADLVLSMRLQFLDELSPQFIIIRSSDSIIGYDVVKTIDARYTQFSLYKKVRKRSLSYRKRRYTWDEVLAERVPYEYLNSAISCVRYQLGQGDNYKMANGEYFAKTKSELIIGLHHLICQGRDYRNLNACGSDNCMCRHFGPPKPWDNSCSERYFAMRHTICGDLPCYCTKLGPKTKGKCCERDPPLERVKTLNDDSCVQYQREQGDNYKARDYRNLKVCGSDNCMCRYFGPPKPWDISCSERYFAMRRSICGDLPCYCAKLGPRTKGKCCERDPPLEGIEILSDNNVVV